MNDGAAADDPHAVTLATDGTVVDERVLLAMRPGRELAGTRWQWRPATPLPLHALPSPREAAAISSAHDRARADDEKAVRQAASNGVAPPALTAPELEAKRPRWLRAELRQITWWSWPCEPETAGISVAVLEFGVELGAQQSGVKALDVFAPRWPGGRLGNRVPQEKGKAEVSDDLAVGLREFLQARGLEPCTTESVSAWHLGWNHLNSIEAEQAARVAVSCGDRPGSAHFGVVNRKLLLLRRDEATPEDFLDRVGIPKDVPYTRSSYGSFSSLGAEALAYACAQRAGLDAFRRRFGQDLQHLGTADFRRRYRQWLQFRHRFPTEIHLESVHMNELYRAAAQQLGITALATSVDEEHRLSMQLERDTSADETNRAIYQLTIITGGFSLLAACVAIADGARSDRADAWHSYAFAVLFTIALVAIYTEYRKSQSPDR